jgi:hypothetical protein
MDYGGKMKKGHITVFYLLLLFLSLEPLYAQSYPRSAILDEAIYESLPRKAALHSRALDVLPRAASLKQFAPLAGDQGMYGTCTAWATSYAARTIAESVGLNRQNRTDTTSNVFSPVYVYKRISNDPNCQQGTIISHALDVMIDPGLPRRSTAERTADFKVVPLSIYQQSLKFPIADYATLYSTRRGETGYDLTRIQAVKKSLAEGKPVIIGMNTPDSFFTAKSPWQPQADPGTDHGGHAMCVVGYDDSRYGGAFEIQNSWGENWGEQGYIWIRYEDFTRFVNQAYELIENLSTYKDAARYSGFVDIELSRAAGGMPVRFDERGFYRTVSSYPSGTEFRFLLGNDHPAFVYAFSADSSTANTAVIFPLAEKNQSPALDYSKNIIAWPGEYDWIQMDDVIGTDYLVVLYSKQKLDIDAIRSRFSSASGSFPERVARAVGSNYVQPSRIQFDKSQIKFSASSTNSNAVMGLLLAIDHHKGVKR